MPDKVHLIEGEKESLLLFFCPGCKNTHPVRIKAEQHDGALPVWSWNGSKDKPSFVPSLLCNGFHAPSRCHSFIVDGQIRFLADCYHELAGQTIDIPDWED